MKPAMRNGAATKTLSTENTAVSLRHCSPGSGTRSIQAMHGSKRKRRTGPISADPPV